MAIRQSKYIDITSGVGGASAVSNRELIARVFTTNALCGIGHAYEFDSADAVMEYFGANSDEYKFAAKYFGFISKSVSKAKKISFFRWSSTDSSPYIAARTAADTVVSNYTSSNCKIAIKDGDSTDVITVTFDSPDDITEVVSQIQSAIRAYGSASKYSTATLAITDSKAKLTLPNSITSEIVPCVAQDVEGSQDDLATLLGLVDGTVCSNYTSAQTPAEAASKSDALSDNYGSFMFVGGTALTNAENRAVAEWNATKNYKYLFCIGIQGYTDATGALVNSSAINSLASSTTGVGGISGVCVWAYKNASDYITAFPAALFATTDYSRANTTKTFMYQQNDSLTAAIASDTGANALDALYVNYIGVTQSAGGLIQFSQDGFNMDGVDTAVYCNEIWMKASFWAAIMNLFLAVEKVPANDVGSGMIKTVMMDTISTAIKNGTIQPHKDFTTTQKAYIGQVLDNTEAWKDVWSNGYVLDITIESVNSKYVAKYILVYSKGDAIRKVEGSDILI